VLALLIAAYASLIWSKRTPFVQLDNVLSNANTGHSGDGRADVVCFEVGGTMTSWLNTKDEGMKNVGQIKKTEGW
jgi:hypothetical protein